jgi:hypothetical protein
MLVSNCGGNTQMDLGQKTSAVFKNIEGPENKFVIPASSISEDELWNGLKKSEGEFCSTNIENRQFLKDFWMLNDMGIRLFTAVPYHNTKSSGLALPSACEDSTLTNFYLVGENTTPLNGNPHFKDYLITNQGFEYASVLWPNRELKLADKGIYIVAEGEDVEGKVKYNEAQGNEGLVYCQELEDQKQKVFEAPGIDGKIVLVEDGVYQYDEGECYPLFEIYAEKDSPNINPKKLIGVLSVKNSKRKIDFLIIKLKGNKNYILPYLPHLGSLDFEDWSEEISTSS